MSAVIGSHQQSSAVIISSLQRLAQIIKGHRAGDDVKGPDAVSRGESVIGNAQVVVVLPWLQVPLVNIPKTQSHISSYAT